ncbi:MAG: alpha/beta fold hydrolase [Rubrivivax sp.]|nr:alpha/beta fold hydrolase [Rubrivivax sp.]
MDRPTPAQAARAFLTPRPPAAPLPLQLPGATALRLPTAEVELAALAAGSGPTVLLVHGWEGQASDLQAIADALLAHGHRVVALDLPAHGASGGRRTSIPASARALLQAGPALGPLHAVVAHSVGSAVAVTAMARGLAVGRAALLAAPAFYADHARGFARQLGLDATGTAQMIERLRDEGVDVDAIAAPKLVGAFTQPALYIHSADDRVVPIADARAGCAAWPGARLWRVDGLGHRRLLGEPAVVAAVAAFVAGGVVPAGAAGGDEVVAAG